MTTESKTLTIDDKTGFKVKIKTGGDADKYLVVDNAGALSWGDTGTSISGVATDPSTWKVSNKWLAVSSQTLSFTGSSSPGGFALLNGLLSYFSGTSAYCLGTNANGAVALVTATAIDISP